ncbi:MAG: aldo/keto reductase [Eubacteriales bacterium]|nr:aldo/keto reductase [Eubacteriales bacterium]
MQYVPFGKTGKSVSRLGFGTMRLPTVENEEGQSVINRDEAIAMIRRAIDGGVNYVDTAYGYHQGESEALTGLALKGGYRERVMLTTKLPQWLVKEAKDMDRLLDEQLKKLDVAYLDFYLLHALDLAAFRRLKSLGYQDFLKRARADGRIRHAGFSFHDDKDAFIEIIDDYPWDMAQIQFNYLDDETQATLEGLKYAGKRGIPVVIMEPLRGGALANPPPEVQRLIAGNQRGYSPVEWAFRYCGQFPEVATILSGMSTMEQVEDNLRVFERVSPGNLDTHDQAFIKSLKDAYLKRLKVACTACQYCQPCPEGVRIPDIFEIYNEAYMLDCRESLGPRYGNLAKAEGDASRCVACGQCEAICPQQLPIIELIKDIHEEARTHGA